LAHQKVVPPDFSKHLKSQDVPEGSQLTLECHTTGIPCPAISWLKDDTNIDNSPEYVITKINGTCCLKVRKVLPEHAGRYTCKATNPGGEASSSARLNVISVKKPYFHEPLKNLTGKEGESVKLECHFSAEPTPQIQWLRNDAPIQASPAFRVRVCSTGKPTGTCVISQLSRPSAASLSERSLRPPPALQRLARNLGGEARTSCVLDTTAAIAARKAPPAMQPRIMQPLQNKDAMGGGGEEKKGEVWGSEKSSRGFRGTEFPGSGWGNLRWLGEIPTGGSGLATSPRHALACAGGTMSRTVGALSRYANRARVGAGDSEPDWALPMRSESSDWVHAGAFRRQQGRVFAGAFAAQHGGAAAAQVQVVQYQWARRGWYNESQWVGQGAQVTTVSVGDSLSGHVQVQVIQPKPVHADTASPKCVRAGVQVTAAQWAATGPQEGPQRLQHTVDSNNDVINSINKAIDEVAILQANLLKKEQILDDMNKVAETTKTRFIQPLENAEINEGQKFTFQCRLPSDTAEPKIEWFKDNMPLTSPDYQPFLQFPGGTFPWLSRPSGFSGGGSACI
ncbi:hypothetical protein NP493_4345g00004, partial [Ridgeia piscesae]